MRKRDKKIQHLGDVAWCECKCHTRGLKYPLMCNKCYSNIEGKKRVNMTTKNNWEKDLESLLIEWEGKSHPVLGSIRVASRTKTLKSFIHSNFISKEELRKWIKENRAIFNLSDMRFQKIKDKEEHEEAGMIGVRELLELMKENEK